MYSKLTITFNENLSLLGGLNFTVTDLATSNTSQVLEYWVLLRLSANEVTIKPDLPILGATSARGFMKSFNTDYNSSNIYTVTTIDNVVVIESTVPTLSFSAASSFQDITFVYDNFAGTAFYITESVFEQATDPCLKVKLKITTSTYADIVNSPNGTITRIGNIIYTEVVRSIGAVQSTVAINLANNSGETAQSILSIPSVLAEGNLVLDINTSPTGATIIANANTSLDLNLEYSLGDGSTQGSFQVSNIFSGIEAGDYTLYVKDQYGCSYTHNFSVDAFGVNVPYFKISKSNSIRFVGRSLGGLELNKKIDENRLSFEDEIENKVFEQQTDFTNLNAITTQFKTNYTNPSVKVYEGSTLYEGATLLETITPSKLTNNLRLRDSRDAIKFDNGFEKTGVYFSTGNIYNFDTGIDTGNDYTLNGSLPEWAVKGNYIKIGSDWLLIEDVMFDDSRMAEYIVINIPYTGEDTSVIVSSTYNRENYEVWEFINVFTSYLGKKITLEIESTDSTFDTLIWGSEFLSIYESLPEHTEIKYANNSNTDIMYSTGIVHLINERVEKIDDAPQGDSKNYSTDNSTSLESANIKELKEFTFSDCTRGQLIKLYRSMYHTSLYIDETGYVISETPEVESSEDGNNLYTLKAKLVKTGLYYNATSFDFDEPISIGLLEMPALINTGDGYIKI